MASRQIPGRRRASALIMVFALMFILVTLVAGLHYRQSSAKASLFHEESNLLARVAAEYELARQCHPEATFEPVRQPVGGKLTRATEAALVDPLAAKGLFSDKGLLDVGTAKTMAMDKSLKARAGLGWSFMTTTSSDPAMKPDRARFLTVLSNAFPYAACAPRGKIKVGDAFAWRNPLYPKDKDTLKVNSETAYSGGPLRMAAGGSIQAGNCTYGELYTVNGTFEVSGGRYLAFAGLPPDIVGAASFPNSVTGQMKVARNDLTSQAQDKTSLFNENSFEVSKIAALFKGEGDNFLAGLLSMRQAMHFPFFMIPGGKWTAPCFLEVWLHMPYAPDFPLSDKRVDQIGSKNQAEVDKKRTALEEKEKKIKDLEAQEKAEADPDKKAQLAKDKAAAQKDKQQEADDLEKMSGDVEAEMKEAVKDSQAEKDTGPLNRSAEAGMDDAGVKGYSYGPAYTKYGEFYKTIGLAAIAALQGKMDEVKQVFSDWGDSLYQNVRLVHFGGKDYDTEFSLDKSKCEFTATFNVPQGRAVALNVPNVNIKGDLWLMRGSTLIIGGNLTLEDPESQNTPDIRKPRGRIFLEEGCNLVVKGDLTCAGTPYLGSILVGAPVGQIHPTMTSILVDGDITIPYGVWPAFSLGDLDLAGIPELKTFRDILASVVPNLAKVAGPFHRRKPYFSSYATRFMIAAVLIPPIPAPIIVPIPFPVPAPNNVNVKIFRALSTIFAVQMNLAWGENFVTHCDWWLLGQGTVPMFPKVNPTVYLSHPPNLKLPGLDKLPSSDQVLDEVKNVAPELIKTQAPKLITELVVKLVISQLTFGFGDAVVDAIPIEEMLRAMLPKGSETSLSEAVGVDRLMTTIKDEISNHAAAMLLFETPGVMIYSGGTIQVAVGGARTPVTIGMLVAEGDIVSNASVTVGAALSLRGDVTLNKLLYDPNTTRVSLFVPNNVRQLDAKVAALEWLSWATEVLYGPYFKGNEKAVDIAPSLPHPTVQGWTL